MLVTFAKELIGGEPWPVACCAGAWCAKKRQEGAKRCQKAPLPGRLFAQKRGSQR